MGDPSNVRHSYLSASYLTLGTTSNEIFKKNTSLSFPTKGRLDSIENHMSAILIRLQKIAESIKLSDIEDTIVDFDKNPSLFINLKNPSTDRPFRRETNFSERNYDERIPHIKEVAKNILLTLGYIFFGYQSFNSDQDAISIEQMMKNLNHDFLLWNQELKTNYKESYQIILDKSFKHASTLLTNRKNDARTSYYQRMTFYVSLTLSLIGKRSNARALTILGLAISSLTLIFMLVHYGRSSLKLATLACHLKDSVKNAEKHLLDP